MARSFQIVRLTAAAPAPWGRQRSPAPPTTTRHGRHCPIVQDCHPLFLPAGLLARQSRNVGFLLVEPLVVPCVSPPRRPPAVQTWILLTHRLKMGRRCQISRLHCRICNYDGDALEGGDIHDFIGPHNTCCLFTHDDGWDKGGGTCVGRDLTFSLEVCRLLLDP